LQTPQLLRICRRVGSIRTACRSSSMMRAFCRSILGLAEVMGFVVDPPGVTFRIERRDKMSEYAKLIIRGGQPIKQPGVTSLVRSGSPLDELHKVSQHLGEQSVSQKYDYATLFVLTGEPPEERNFLTERSPRGQVVIHIAHWISAESMKNAYRRELWFRS
jgi:hypothetical protein